MQVPRLQSVVRDRRANWNQSLSTLRAAKAAGVGVTKTSIMLGCGEQPEEVLDAMRQLRESGNLLASSILHCRVSDNESGALQRLVIANVNHLCGMPVFRKFWRAIPIGIEHVTLCPGVDVVTLGQYMRPTKRHMAVAEYVTPEAFQMYQAAAEQMGFLYTAAGPMVRSSYRAGEFYLKNVLRKRQSASA